MNPLDVIPMSAAEVADLVERVRAAMPQRTVRWLRSMRRGADVRAVLRGRKQRRSRR